VTSIHADQRQVIAASTLPTYEQNLEQAEAELSNARRAGYADLSYKRPRS